MQQLFEGFGQRFLVLKVDDQTFHRHFVPQSFAEAKCAFLVTGFPRGYAGVSLLEACLAGAQALLAFPRLHCFAVLGADSQAVSALFTVFAALSALFRGFEDLPLLSFPGFGKRCSSSCL